MDFFVIDGGRPLRGAVAVSGSKNAALPILIATLLTDEPCVIKRVPTHLRDVRTTVHLLESLGKRIEVLGSTVHVSAGRRLKTRAPYDLVKQMRASVWVAGPLLGRFGKVSVPIPGGCSIGLRPIDIHLAGFAAFGARRDDANGDVILRAAKLKPARLRLKFPSVGATENLMMCAAAIPGESVIDNAAREPEIADLGAFLNKLGAEVSGAGTSRVKVRGAARLHGAVHGVIADRIEAGTFLIACAAAGGKLRVNGAEAGHLRAVLDALRAAGAAVKVAGESITIARRGAIRPVSVATKPYPGFPTDLQAPWLSLMSFARGRSRIVENVFENRFLHVAELARMGARIELRGNAAVVDGAAELNGAPVMASDLRAGAALLIAALAARGRTLLQRVYHIDRGYERIELKLRRAGARIRRLN